ncbi:MAG: two-component sensor histidine kinase [Silicimonas sp.]|nr:two-component sensor histidine kinase [Silicimonas sp.]
MAMKNRLVDALPLPAVLLGSDGRVMALNSLAKTVFGLRIEGLHFMSAFRQPALLEAIDSALRDGGQTHASYLAKDARGDIALEATCGSLGPDAGLLICLEDRTATKAAGQMRRDFVANVSHELRTPLTALLGFIETLRGAARDDPEARDRFLGIMEREANRMTRLVTDLLSLSRVEAEERVAPTEPVDLAGVARSVLATLEPMAREGGIDVQTNGLDQPVVVRGDSDQLAQVVTNLVENALKYAGDGGRVDLALSRAEGDRLVTGRVVVLGVRDYGEGIDSLHIPRLTERFYRIDDHRSRELGGTGLGLAIVKHIMNRHRGRLEIESTPGKGSEFKVILPDPEPNPQ